jgi:hypothetical protein
MAVGVMLAQIDFRPLFFVVLLYIMKFSQGFCTRDALVQEIKGAALQSLKAYETKLDLSCIRLRGNT